MKLADLHLHTVYSDGSATPDEIVRTAKRNGLDAIAVTDHDTLDGLAETFAAGQAQEIEIIAGVEITSRVGTQEVHILGYFFHDDWRDPVFHKVLEHAKHLREQRALEFVARFHQLGIPLTLAEIKACSSCGTLGRMHVALALQRRGVVNSVEEAFERFLRRGKPGFVDRPRMTAAEAIGQIRRAGGVAALAHPGLNNVDKQIPEMMAQGMTGLEVWHSRHTPAQTEHYLAMTRALGLLPTGGTDAHDANPGLVRIPYEHVETLKSCLT